METNNVNQNVKELTDEQLKKVAGGNILPGCYSNLPGCLKIDKDCKCTQCKEGLVLVSGKCQIQG